MRSFSTTARVSGVAAATVALLATGLFGVNTAAAQEQPIDPDRAHEIMETPWPEYEVGDVHGNIELVSTYLTLETDEDGKPFWDEHPTRVFTEELADAVENYQAHVGLDEQRRIGEPEWDHFSDGQFPEDAFDWGPPAGNNFYGPGDSGKGVGTVQFLLVERGYLDPGQVDEQYGSETEAAVEEFQADKVCPEIDVSEQECVDGLTGEVTYRALVSVE
ncbi:peptidoglycan-binding protein [Nocardiopsis sp. HNM0947]|uniref:Peptidoglycan-binding protein n=1 Tax=Nocardiopsis coralli TaxID=2772213 RepID=A0ABR9PBL1_9ACTN|nr:peptidoglycan-binding protein [Nocardiopsis coralli]MBE3001217.1 peptidoglycan-binding protein [Nocardiopsis coralli]